MFLKDSLHTLLIRVLSYSCAFLVQILVANYLGASSKGELQIAMFAMSVVTVIVGMGFERAIIYHIGKKLYPLQQIWSNTLVYLLTAVLGGTIVLFPVFYLARPIFGQIGFGVLIIAFLLVPFDRFFSFQLGVYNGSGKIRHGNSFTLIESVLFVGFAALFMIWILPSTAGVLWAYILAFLMAGVISAVYLAKHFNLAFRPMANARLIKYFLAYGLKGQIGNLTKLIATRIDLLLLNYFMGKSWAGIYSVAINFGDMLFFLPIVLSYVIFPHASRRDQDQGWILTGRVSRISFAFTLISAIVVAVTAPILIPIFFPPVFIDAIKPLWILLPGVVMFSTFRVMSSGISGLGYPLIQSICTSIAVTSSVLLNLLLIPRYQHLGAAMASSISYILAQVVLLAIIKFKFRMRVLDFMVPSRDDLRLIRERARAYLNREQKR